VDIALHPLSKNSFLSPIAMPTMYADVVCVICTLRTSGATVLLGALEKLSPCLLCSVVIASPVCPAHI
jgi:hypothetical protein